MNRRQLFKRIVDTATALVIVPSVTQSDPVSAVVTPSPPPMGVGARFVLNDVDVSGWLNNIECDHAYDGKDVVRTIKLNGYWCRDADDFFRRLTLCRFEYAPEGIGRGKSRFTGHLQLRTWLVESPPYSIISFRADFSVLARELSTF